MKIRHFQLLALVAVAISAVCIPRASSAAAGVSFDFFYDSLDPYGEWVELPDYGYCWHPSGVDADWAPYSDGYWTYTDAGWTWVSYEDWGAITYHYGRWVRLNDLGWCWVPSYEWGPAWVSWRSNDEVVGWAPLPPEVVFSDNAGISVWVDSAYGIGPGYYNFCRFHDFGAPALRPCIINRNQNAVFLVNTVNITNITVNPHRHVVFNHGPDFRLVQSKSAHPIQTLRLVMQPDVNAAKASGNGFFARQHGNQLDVLAPAINPPSAGERPRPKHLGNIASTASVDKGWNHVPESQVKQIQTKIRQQSAELTPEKTHARPVSDKDLQIITENTKSNAAPPLPTVQSPSPAVGNEPAREKRDNRSLAEPSNTPPPAISTRGTESARTPTAQMTAAPTPSGNTKVRRGQIESAQPTPRQAAIQPNTRNTAPEQAVQPIPSNREKVIERQRQFEERPAVKVPQPEPQPQQVQRQPFLPQAKQPPASPSEKNRKKSKDEKDLQ